MESQICADNHIDDMGYKISERKASVCLECGDRIRYGRTDKKFCCDACKVKHHNKETRESRAFRRKILSRLDRNHAILESLLHSGITSVDMTDILSLGFSPNLATSYNRFRSHCEYCCFDIKYRLTPSRVSFISKIQNVSLPLQAGMEMNEQ